MDPITNFDQDYLTIVHINGLSVPELIDLLEKASKNSEFPAKMQRTDACLDATYLRLDGEEDDGIPTPEEVAAAEAEGIVPEEQTYTEHPFYKEDGSLADAPGKPGEPIMLEIAYHPNNFLDSNDTEYDVIDLMSDGCGKFHVYDTYDEGLLIDYDKFDYLMGILKRL